MSFTNLGDNCGGKCVTGLRGGGAMQKNWVGWSNRTRIFSFRRTMNQPEFISPSRVRERVGWVVSDRRGGQWWCTSSGMSFSRKESSRCENLGLGAGRCSPSASF